VHRQSRNRLRAIFWGLVVATCVFAATAAGGAAAQQPNPQPLWNAYPLDADGSGTQNASTTTTQAQAAPSPASTTTRAPVTVTETAGDGPPWALMIAAGAGGALFVVVLLTLQGRRARRRHGDPLVATTEEWPWLTAKPNGAAQEFHVERLANAPGRPTTNGIVEEPRGERAANRVAGARPAEPERATEAERAANGHGAKRAAERERAAERARAAERERAAERARAAEREREREAERATAAERERDAEQERVAEQPSNGGATDPAADREWPTERERDAERERVAERARAAERAHAAETEQAAVPEPVAAAPPEPDFDAVPRRRFDREPVKPKPRAAASRQGPICQVRWSAPGTCFYAVTTGADEVERRIAWSPPIEWTEPGPPDEDSRQARAALRVISKELRDKGWRPMRAKGADFDEQRWYARRFRLPVVEDEPSVTPDRQRSGSARA
jgi:hypothetical protein